MGNTKYSKNKYTVLLISGFHRALLQSTTFIS